MRKFKQGLKMAAAGMVVMAGPSLAYAGESVDYSADGANYQGYYAPASGEAKGLVLVIHDGL